MGVRIAVLDRSVCIEKKCGYVCMKVCPPNRMGEECIYIEEGGVFPVISEELCIGCGLCVKKCPVSCIEIINLAHELEDPIFQYGINTFRLYRLPLPREGSAVALVGKNGIGKSTALKLLAGQLSPNFAIFDRKISEEDFEKKLRPEWRRFLGQKRKVSIKPQNIERIRSFKGTVRQLLSQTGVSEEAIALFSLNPILEREVSALSGGELQRVALAVCYGRDADIYYIDEPTNYLDIGERLRTAIIMKSLTEKGDVLFVEHDLTVLDYVSDYVYVFYGEENTYGVVSGIKNTRNGINEYLAGYLKDENVRFRDHDLKFSSFSEVERTSKILYSYPALEKTLSSFAFKSEEGEIREGEVVGIVGKNALGKTLFLNELKSIFNASVSHKPQYLSPKEVLVKEYLEGGRAGVVEECKRAFRLQPIMEKRMDELSGGQLQRVEITKALSI